jgi:DNA polymerase III subunit gamma/tau
MVFYRKYRPQTISDLDSASVRETLFAVLQKDIPHAFLFTGPKGLGKTSTARIVAKVVNCTGRAINKEQLTKNEEQKGKVLSQKSSVQSGESVEPCGKCDQCVSITNGTNIDVLEIDAASNRGIDEIRELKEKIRLAPVAARRKVYIIDEVHMLTTEAFNALLKTLEEPPGHAMFVLCTTEAHKVPETIVSRCFQIHFQLAKDSEIVNALRKIKEEEKINIDEPAIEDIAHSSDGSYRDATKVLEEMVLLAAGKKIDSKFVDEHYHIHGLQVYIKEFLLALASKNTKVVLNYIASSVNQGTDMKYILTKLTEALHELLLQNIDSSFATRYYIPGNTFSLDEIKYLIELFSKAGADMKYAVLPQLPLELAVIEWCEDKSKVTSQKLQVANKEQSNTVVEDNDVSVSSLRKKVGTMKKIKAMYGSSPAEQNKSDESVSIKTTSVELMHTNGDGTVTREWMDTFWKSFIDEMKKYNHTVAGVLRGCTIKSFAGQTLVIQTAYKFHKERLDDIKNRDSLLKIGKLLTGKAVQIEVELRNRG